MNIVLFPVNSQYGPPGTNDGDRRKTFFFLHTSFKIMCVYT